MVRPQVFRFWLEVSAAVFLIFCWFLAWLSRLQKPSTADMVRFLRGADMKRLSELFLTDGALRGVVSRRSFLQRERLRLHEASEIMRAACYSMSVLIAWAGNELRRESRFLKRGLGDGRSADMVEGHRRLLGAARDFRRYAFLALVKLSIWRVFRTHWWMPAPAPRIATLQKILAWDFFQTYGRIFRAVAEITGQYDDGFTEEILTALFKIHDPDAMLALWRQSGQIGTT